MRQPPAAFSGTAPGRGSGASAGGARGASLNAALAQRGPELLLAVGQLLDHAVAAREGGAERLVAGDVGDVRVDQSTVDAGGDRGDQPGADDRTVRLGSSEGAELQAFVPGGAWQAARAHEGPAGYALVGCVVAPGFEFSDFELAEN